MVAELVVAPVVANTPMGKMKIVRHQRIGLKTTWEEGGEEIGVNEGDETVEYEYGYRLSPSQFDSAMNDCSRKGRGGSKFSSPCP